MGSSRVCSPSVIDPLSMRFSPASVASSIDLPAPIETNTTVIPVSRVSKSAMRLKAPRRTVAPRASSFTLRASAGSSAAAAPPRPTPREPRRKTTRRDALLWIRRREPAAPHRIAIGSVWVSPGTLEAKVMTAPNSPRPAPNAVTAPASTPGPASGNATDRDLSPRSGAQHRRRFKQARIGRLERQSDGAHHQREAHHRRRQRSPFVVKASWMPKLCSSQCPIRSAPPEE